MAFKMKGMDHGEGTGSVYKNVGKTGEYSGSAAFQKNWLSGVKNFVSKLDPRNRKLNPKITNIFSGEKNTPAKNKKTTVIKPKPPQTVSRKEYIPQSQRKSGNTGISYKQAWASDKGGVQSKYKDEASFTKAAKEWNKKNTKKEYTPNRNYNYKPQALK